MHDDTAKPLPPQPDRADPPQITKEMNDKMGWDAVAAMTLRWEYAGATRDVAEATDATR